MRPMVISNAVTERRRCIRKWHELNDGGKKREMDQSSNKHALVQFRIIGCQNHHNACEQNYMNARE
jgi:hypothetical protein